MANIVWPQNCPGLIFFIKKDWQIWQSDQMIKGRWAQEIYLGLQKSCYWHTHWLWLILSIYVICFKVCQRIIKLSICPSLQWAGSSFLDRIVVFFFWNINSGNNIRQICPLLSHTKVKQAVVLFADANIGLKQNLPLLLSFGQCSTKTILGLF